MTKRIAICSQKGGAGKSTIAAALAVGMQFDCRECKVVLADTDHKQRSLWEWSLARNGNGLDPAVTVEVIDLADGGFFVPNAEEADAIIYDCPGWSDESTLLASKMADLVVLPTGPSQKDLRPLIRLVIDLQKKGVDPERIAVVLFRVHTATEEKAARDYIASSSAGIAPVAGYIPDSTTFARADDGGASALEVGTDKQRPEVAKAIGELIEQVDSLTPKKVSVEWAKFDWEAA